MRGIDSMRAECNMWLGYGDRVRLTNRRFEEMFILLDPFREIDRSR